MAKAHPRCTILSFPAVARGPPDHSPLSAMVRHPQDDGSFPMNSPWDDHQRPMCGQKAWNNILTRAVRAKTKPGMFQTSDDGYTVIHPLISPCDSDAKAETDDSPPLDSPSADSRNAQHGDEVSDLIVQEFDPLIAPQARRRRVLPVTLRRASPPLLPSVEEEIDEDAISESLSQPKSLGSSSGDADPGPARSSTNMNFASSIPCPKNIKDVENSKEVESMLKSMRDLILQQQQTLSTMGAQNHQYRLKIAAYQDHFLEMRKDGCNQREQIYRLQLERDSFESEAKWLREEMNKLRREASSLRMKYDENMLRKMHTEEMVTTPRISNTHPKTVPEETASQVGDDRPQGDVCAEIESFDPQDSPDRPEHSPEVETDSTYPSESRDDDGPRAVEETKLSEEAISHDERDDLLESSEVVSVEPRKKVLVRFSDQIREGAREGDQVDESSLNPSIGSVDFYKEWLKQIHMKRAHRRNTQDCRPTEMAQTATSASIITI